MVWVHLHVRLHVVLLGLVLSRSRDLLLRMFLAKEGLYHICIPDGSGTISSS